jgi:hypothetical protein
MWERTDSLCRQMLHVIGCFLGDNFFNPLYLSKAECFWLFSGASSGIGAATAILFSKFGATLSLTGRNLQNLEKTAEQCTVDEGWQKKPLLIQGSTDCFKTKSTIDNKIIRHLTIYCVFDIH